MTHSSIGALAEVVGLPGSGKTTLCTALSADGVGLFLFPVRMTGSGGLFGRVTALLSTPTFSLLVYAATLTRKGCRLEHLRRAYAIQRRYRLLRRLDQRERVIVDEGVVHALGLCFFSSKSTPLSSVFLRMLLSRIVRITEFFVLLDIDRVECLTRARRRVSASRFGPGMTHAEIERFLTDSSYEEIVRELELLVPDKVIRCGDVAMGQRTLLWLLGRKLASAPLPT